MQLNIYLSSFSSTCFGLTHPSSGAMDVTISLAYGVLGLVQLGVGPEECVCWWRVALLAVQHTNSTHTPQDRHLTRLNQGHHMLHMLKKL